MLIQQLFSRIKTAFLRTYVYCAWNFEIFYEIIKRRREKWLKINDLRILYDNSGLVIINKHPELLINSTRPFLYCVTLQMQLFYNRPNYANWELENMFNFMNRLDYPTSGLICIAYKAVAAGLVGRAFTKGRVGKQYIAIVWGHVGTGLDKLGPNTQLISPHVWRIQIPLGSFKYKRPDGRIQKIMVPDSYPDCRKPRECCTIAVVLEYGFLKNCPATRLLLIPKTGRRHQLRLHCAIGLGHPIAGDLTYVKRPFDHPSLEYPNQIPDHDIGLDYGLDRMMLHSYHINFKFEPKPVPSKLRSRKPINSAQSVLQDIDICTNEDPFFEGETESHWEVCTTVNDLSDWRDVYDV